MEENLPDLDKEYPTFQELFYVAGKYGLDEIPFVILDRNGQIVDPLVRISMLDFQFHFFQYLVEIQGNKTPNSEKEMNDLWDKRFFTLNHLMNSISNREKRVQQVLETSNRLKIEINEELRKRIPDKAKKERVEDFTNEEMGLYLYFSGDKPPSKRGSIYNRFNFYQNEINRKFKTAKQAKPLIERFEIIIPFISNPQKKDIAQNELDELKIAYYEDTGIKIE